MSLIISLREKLSQVVRELIDEIKKQPMIFFLISTEELKNTHFLNLYLSKSETI